MTDIVLLIDDARFLAVRNVRRDAAGAITSAYVDNENYEFKIDGDVFTIPGATQFKLGSISEIELPPEAHLWDCNSRIEWAKERRSEARATPVLKAPMTNTISNQNFNEIVQLIIESSIDETEPTNFPTFHKQLAAAQLTPAQEMIMTLASRWHIVNHGYKMIAEKLDEAGKMAKATAVNDARNTLIACARHLPI